MYLVLETHRPNGDKFIHFIDLSKSEIVNEFDYLLYHLREFPFQKVDKAYMSKDRLSQW